MHKKRNVAIHEYSEEDIDALIILIRDSFIPAFEKLLHMLVEKEAEAESDSWDNNQRSKNG